MESVTKSALNSDTHENTDQIPNDEFGRYFYFLIIKRDVNIAKLTAMPSGNNAV